MNFTKKEIFDKINAGTAKHNGSVRTADKKVQLDKWIVNDQSFLVTSFGKLRNDLELTSPNYSNERLEHLSLIE